MSARPTQSTPVLALTMGDACGIGPEIIARLWLDAAMPQALVLGSPQVMRRAAEWVACAQSRTAPLVAEIHDPKNWANVPPGAVPVWAPPGLPADLMEAPVGQVDVRAGQAAAACIRAAVRLAQTGLIAGIVTAPLHKEALALAGEPYPGHTELLQAEGAPQGQPPAPVRMMLANEQLKTVLVTIHMALRQAIEAVTFESVLETIRITHDSAKLWGVDQPRIAVAGLNPHAGEGGLFGDEEIRIIGPAIAAARALDIDVSGPLAPDTVFMRARHAADHPGEFDVVIAMYHDQGLIPVKYMGLDHGVNVTLGLPFVRTSPDHGTAFDLAGTGRADPSSLLQAWRMARQLVSGRGGA
ncbi:4-hydroxythreonine-4-phosphate dehydrogenase PdxA [Aquabacterium sp. CECT 9606]|uniref:4-hydroxythreonine-4-phosphate dehydrogenase PdxA n=1 Tax=Aquabacterium sp. CECT 9606 TaxID=2845822 RepID=UPI001E417C80|nr:4-hydroxythreonine-4-phosphate dehydrogenase PdxA [Aquabacterium sp. CECT 9606]CAH0349098.1 D-threonate 4-phosphate dehydrogenase [Aquabacterium sp. CECT 9606]